MDQRAITPTITHRVRAFLQCQGEAGAPWSGLNNGYAELYALLRRRQGLQAIWQDRSRFAYNTDWRESLPEGECARCELRRRHWAVLHYRGASRYWHDRR